ncbi:EamA family transporter [Streptomyces virginiae]|uniref:EamA family transporter n=1 Tax=Streptomyces virginiae TaxID=1961 RepID=UPI0035DAE98C
MATCRAPFYIVTTELLPPAHPLFAGLLRALPAGLIALAFTRGSPRGAWWGRGAVLGTLNIGLLFPLLFIAAERLPGGVAATLTAAVPLMVTLLPVTFLAEGPPPAIGATAALGYLWLSLVCGLATFVLWFQGIGLLPVTSAAMLGLLSLLVAAMLGAVLLGQTLGPVQLVGFGLALAAIVAGQLPAPGRPTGGSGRRAGQSCGGREPSWWSATFRASSTSRRR